MNRSIKFLTPLLLVAPFIFSTNSSALTYQQDTGVNFTILPSFTVTLSSSDIIINNLVAGTSSDSNTITINVKTNNITGYTLNATVGNGTYDNRNLNNLTAASNFSSLDVGSSVASLSAFSENKWGFSFSSDDGSTWSNYSGLPLYSDYANVATLKASTSPSLPDGDNIEFKIGARASINQPSGTYNNVINFMIVPEPVPISLYDAYEGHIGPSGKLNGYYKLQDMSPLICEESEAYGEDSAMQVIDERDNKVYWITKLADDRCWMTQNLDYDLNSNVALTSEGSDVVNPWTPLETTYRFAYQQNYIQVDNISGRSGIFSIDPGDYCWDGVRRPTSATVNRLVLEMMEPSCTDTHYHLGNYYSFGAAVASSTPSGSGGGASQPTSQTICPSNWTLPPEEYYNTLINQANLNYNNVDASPFYFIFGGIWDSASGAWGDGRFAYVASDGMYWTSSSNNHDCYGTQCSSRFAFNSSEVKVDDEVRVRKLPVRCVARE